jgi:hypothetical protein
MEEDFNYNQFQQDELYRYDTIATILRSPVSTEDFMNIVHISAHLNRTIEEKRSQLIIDDVSMTINSIFEGIVNMKYPGMMDSFRQLVDNEAYEIDENYVNTSMTPEDYFGPGDGSQGPIGLH